MSALAVVLAAVLAAAALTHQVLPVVDAHVVTGRADAASLRTRTHRVAKAIEMAIASKRVRPDMTPADLARLPDILVEADLLASKHVISPFTGKKIRHERSPFNYAFRTVDGQKMLCLYDFDGREIRFPLTTGSSLSPP